MELPSKPCIGLGSVEAHPPRTRTAAPIAPAAAAAADRTLIAIVLLLPTVSVGPRIPVAAPLAAPEKCEPFSLFALATPHVRQSPPAGREVECGNDTVTYGRSTGRPATGITRRTAGT